MTRVAAVVVALLVVSACGVRPERKAIAEGDRDVPFSLLETTTTTTSPVGTDAMVPVQVCFHDGGDAVVAVERRARTAGAAAALRAYSSGPTPAEQAQGLASALFDRSLVTRVVVAGGVATIDLTPAFAEAGTSTQLEIVAEVVCTVTARPGVGQVSFQISGQPVEVQRGDGSLAADPVSRDDYPQIRR